MRSEELFGSLVFQSQLGELLFEGNEDPNEVLFLYFVERFDVLFETQPVALPPRPRFLHSQHRLLHVALQLGLRGNFEKFREMVCELQSSLPCLDRGKVFIERFELVQIGVTVEVGLAIEVSQLQVSLRVDHKLVYKLLPRACTIHIIN